MITLKEKTELSLSIMHDMRKKLISNMLEKEPEIYLGLHTSDNDSVRKLYYDKYLLTWLDDHWTQLEEFIKEVYGGHNIHEKEVKNLKEYFITYFKEFNESMGRTTSRGTYMLSEIKVKIEAFNEMIGLNDVWDKNLGKLRVDRKKHEEEYKRMVEKFKSEVN